MLTPCGWWNAAANLSKEIRTQSQSPKARRVVATAPRRSLYFAVSLRQIRNRVKAYAVWLQQVGIPQLGGLHASKGGIEAFTKVAAVELGSRSIRVNCVAPGAIEVERTKTELPDYAGK